MTTATGNDRLRQIAILITSVDADAARQLLLHLPTDKALQVRAIAAQLGSVSAAEKRRILADFQRSAAAPGRASGGDRTSSMASQGEATHPPTSATAGRHSALASGEDELGNPVQREQPAAGDEPPFTQNAAAWTRLSTQALARFARGERAAVTAVIISQLAPSRAVAVLQQLPRDVGSDVIQRLSRMQDIDPEAMAAIDEHLARSLTEYQHRIESEMENSRRVSALLAAAPDELRQQWHQILNDAHHATQAIPANTQGDPLTGAAAAPAAVDPTSNHLELDRLTDSTMTTAVGFDSKQDDSEEPHSAAPPASRGIQAATVEPNAEVTAASHTLAFPSSIAPSKHAEIDRSLVQLEFDTILELPPHELATLLSSTESELVLLALAGATPGFMQRFYHMLDRHDARVLQNRLQKISALSLRDIDEAQRRIVERAAQLSMIRPASPQTTARSVA